MSGSCSKPVLPICVTTLDANAAHREFIIDNLLVRIHSIMILVDAAHIPTGQYGTAYRGTSLTRNVHPPRIRALGIGRL